MIVTGFPDSVVIVSLHTLKMHTSDNFPDMYNDGINPFMLSTRHENLKKNITRFDCYDLNDHCIMEIDHVFVSGAVVGCATMHEWGCSLLRTQRGAGWHHECVLMCPTTASDTKTWSIPTTLQKAWQYQMQKINQTSNSQNTLHVLPSWISCIVSILSI